MTKVSPCKLTVCKVEVITCVLNLRLGNPKVRFVDPRQAHLNQAQILFETEGTSVLTPPYSDL